MVVVDLIYINAAAYDLFIDTHMIHEIHHPSSSGEGLEFALLGGLSQILIRLHDEHVSPTTVDALVQMTAMGSNRFMSNFGGGETNTKPEDIHPMDNVQFYYF
jgi:hypothetical protein